VDSPDEVCRLLDDGVYLGVRPSETPALLALGELADLPLDILLGAYAEPGAILVLLDGVRDGGDTLLLGCRLLCLDSLPRDEAFFRYFYFSCPCSFF
jgi:hypothetical protein